MGAENEDRVELVVVRVRAREHDHVCEDDLERAIHRENGAVLVHGTDRDRFVCPLERDRPLDEHFPDMRGEQLGAGVRENELGLVA